MRPSRLALAASLAAVAAVAGFRVASAKDDPPEMKLQKPMAASYLDSLLGSWTTASEMTMSDGKTIKATGTVTFAKGVAGTAILEDYSNTSMGGFAGHGIYKLGADGKTASCFWIDNMEPAGDPMKLEGPITDKGFDMSAVLPDGRKFRITLEKAADGHVFKMFVDGRQGMSETYARAK